LRRAATNSATVVCVLHLLIDTSTWLDLAKRRDGQRLIVPLHTFTYEGRVDLLVPQVVIDEFDRNRAEVEKSMTKSLTEQFKQVRQALAAYGSFDDFDRILGEFVFEQWSHQIPLFGAMTTKNFDDIKALFDEGSHPEPTRDEHERVVGRALTKTAPFHHPRNSVADALLIELYATAARAMGSDDHWAFVTSNHRDFSAVGADARLPHEDFAGIFEPTNSTYYVGVEGLEEALRNEFGDELDELVAHIYFSEDPRRLDEIQAAEKELFDKIWYIRSLVREQELEGEGNDDEIESLRTVASPGRKRVEEAYGADNLGPYTDFEWGMLNGKLSALRWVLGSEWDFLDT
jgi:PIN domain